MRTAEQTLKAPIRDDEGMISVLEIMDVFTGERRVIKEFGGVIIEAPNWLKTEQALVYNSQGKIFKISLEDGKVSQVDTGFCEYCNNDHVLAPDHKTIAVSHHTKEDYHSRVYIIDPVAKTQTLVTPMAPSYLHGWSPDGSALAYSAERNGQYDIYTIPAAGGVERQLTNLLGLDDGPEYAPDGKQIWFNSTRSGLMQVWRMNPDGSDPVHVIDEESNDWFPHVSPDGKYVVFLSYQKGDVGPVIIRRINMSVLK